MKKGFTTARDSFILLLFLALCITIPAQADDDKYQESKVIEDKKVVEEKVEDKKVISPTALLKTYQPEKEAKKTDSSFGMKPYSAVQSISSKDEKYESNVTVTATGIPVADTLHLGAGDGVRIYRPNNTNNVQSGAVISQRPPNCNDYSIWTPFGPSYGCSSN